MRRFASLFATPFLLLALTVPAQAQETTGAGIEAELRSLVTSPTEGDDARATIRAFLADDRVEAAATERGIDSERLSDGVETLDDEQARSLAQRVEDMKAELVGGDTITISASVVIIVLLLLILVAID